MDGRLEDAVEFADHLSAGLVFCNHKTPIRQSKSVAEKLAKLCKAMQPVEDKTASLMQMEVFESLDLPDEGFEAYRDRLFFGRAAVTEDEKRRRALIDAQLAIAQSAGEGMAGLAKRVAALKGRLPRAQLYAMLRLATEKGAVANRSGADMDIRNYYENYLRRAGKEKAPDIAELDVLTPYDAPKPSRALSLAVVAMLWDYIDPLAPVMGDKS